MPTTQFKGVTQTCSELCPVHRWVTRDSFML
ncbi:hypothetical protein SNOG_16057 [Parastagonospora nodorum SN15]|uniref:Uncharacterized protein n=1 Tax=Phaeosphaeria nodorum (strain SN15 / ATCC MYA-4574 / FGSC 10173) TaxID=321614 RepID=Q0TWX8_PHANO|nr:hypothetical protein SNOG_16057 [Parastagonospora nodorum SN15]EAT76636.1 hypothetical protein SNOG_16057 [Parastagonospora nodorum SN15]